MRVAVLSRDLQNSHPGGDITLVEQETAALLPLGIRRDHNPESLEGYDLAHLYHVNFEFSKANLVRAAGLPIVLTTIFFDSPEHGASFGEQRAMLDQARAVISHTPVEAALLRLRTGFRGEIQILPPGAPVAFLPPLADRSGVLTVCARNPLDKGAGRVRDACKDLGIPWYAPQGVPYVDLPTVYWSSRVFVYAEDEAVGGSTISMALLEALTAGCRCLASTYGWGAHSVIPGLFPIDPKDDVGLRVAIRDAYFCADSDWNWGPNVWSQGHTSAVVAQSLARVYVGTW